MTRSAVLLLVVACGFDPDVRRQPVRMAHADKPWERLSIDDADTAWQYLNPSCSHVIGVDSLGAYKMRRCPQKRGGE